MADDPGSVPGQLLDGVAAEEGMVFEAPVVEARVEWSGGKSGVEWWMLQWHAGKGGRIVHDERKLFNVKKIVSK